MGAAGIVAQAARADPPVVDCFDDFSARDGHASLCAPAAAPLSAHLMSLALVLRCRTAQQHCSAARGACWPHLSRPRVSLCSGASSHHLMPRVFLCTGASLCASHVTRTGSPLPSVKLIFLVTLWARGPLARSARYGMVRAKIRRKARGSPPKKRTTGLQFCDFLCTAETDSRARACQSREAV